MLSCAFSSPLAHVHCCMSEGFGTPYLQVRWWCITSSALLPGCFTAEYMGGTQGTSCTPTLHASKLGNSTLRFTQCVTVSIGGGDHCLCPTGCGITVLLISQVDMSSPSRISTVPNLWVPLGERVGWARGIPLARLSLTTQWIHYFLACCWQYYVTIDMYSTV